MVVGMAGDGVGDAAGLLRCYWLCRATCDTILRCGWLSYFVIQLPGAFAKQQQQLVSW
jgi:hypothetical protein